MEVLVVGAGFGQGFLPLYLSHPDVTRVGLCDVRPELESVAARFGIRDFYSSLEDALGSPHWDAVHIASPVHLHVPQTLAVLASGRACASAVPMATSLDDIARVLDAVGSQTYMMMETAIYSREYLHAQQLRDAGELGRISYLSGAHMQDLDGFAPYWMGYPPMQYATHVVAPVLGLADSRATSVSCLGSGELTAPHRGELGPSFGVERALLALDSPTPLSAQVTVSFFENARSYTEGFNVYGEYLALEWPSVEGGPLVMHRAGSHDGKHRGRPIERTLVDAPDQPELLPQQLRQFVRPSQWTSPSGETLTVDASHGGSHPHLVHEFVSATVGGRKSAIDGIRAAEITAPGIVAHQSALRGGELLAVPNYR